MRFFFLIFVVFLVAIVQVQGGGWIRKTRRVIRPRIGPAGAREAAVNIIHLQSARSSSQNNANPWARLFVRRPRFFWTPQIANIRRFRFQPNERRRDNFRQQPIVALSKNTRQPKQHRHRIHGIKIEHGSVRSNGARSAWRPIPSGQNPFIRAPTYEYSPPQIERVKVIEAKHRRPSAPNSNKKQSNGHVKHQRGKKRHQKPKFVWNFPRIGGPNFWKYLYAKRRPMNMMMKPSRPFVKQVPTKRPSAAGASRPVISSTEEMYTKAKIPMMFFRPEESILKPIYQQKPKVSPHQKQKQTPLGTIFVPNHFSSSSVESKEVLPQFKKYPAKQQQQQQQQQQRLRPDIFSQMLGYMNDDKKHRNVLPPFRPYPKPSRPTILKPQRPETTFATTTTTTSSTTTSRPIEPLIVSSMSSTLAPSDDRVNSFNVGILGDSEDNSQVDEVPEEKQVPKVQTSTSVSMSSSIVDDEPVRPLAVDSSDSEDIIGSDSEIIEDIIQSKPNSITTSSTTSTSTTTVRPTTKKSYPTMTPYIRKPRPIFGGKVIQMQNKPKSSTSVETSSWGSGEKLLIHRANSKVKEYKPQFLSNYSQLLSFDKVAEEAKNDDNQGVSEIITPSPSSSSSTSNSPVLTSSTTTEKSSDLFDPVGLLNSWFGKDTPSSS